ncbi:Uncharacterized conserved protein YbjT, contains NAD(P)-binding and DUF2867 domains [Parafrankia irregularis]|uniref:Uncharacterized conserved protein YbjT, contains NAD(P)-binding and DUF2867 domains n=1 Tax=Parafrankia irregularis TaxID=795642 RepID=A0A0S4QHK7_9ACTN|nr:MULTISPECIES: sugar nucleotide-binding protein [Parafrankia]CUU54042.1 Uncharacterized conserved protein YbjT, contains NAD(P)-binding and DUF2867 domains [Parafrankia irregularis]
MTTHTQSNAAKPVLVTVASGKTGRRVAARLTAAGEPVRAVSRSTPTRFDWEDQSTWRHALEGARAAYLCFVPDLGFRGAAETVGAFARLAVSLGVSRLVLLSGRGEEGALAGEQAVRASGAEVTIIRASWFNQNFHEDFLLDSVRAGEIALPAGDAAEPFVDADDIAEVAVAALTGDGHAGEVYEVTGPRLLTFHDVAKELGQALGREIRYVPQTSEQYAAVLTEYGLPLDLLELFDRILDGRNASLTDGVRRALGREPRDFGDYARNTAASGAWDLSL